MTNTIKVLDKGVVILRNISGPTRRVYTANTTENEQSLCPARAFDADDTDVANAARMSFNQTDSGRTYEQEMKLTEYLIKNQHSTPLESIVVWLEYKLPIFVARQFHRHRTQSINEISGRYVTLEPDWYIPEIVGGKAKDKKQGQEDNLSAEVQARFKQALSNACQADYDQYLHYMEQGVAPEHARMLLHTNHYTRYMSTMNLRNLLGFLLLRDHEHAQVEAQAYAKAITQLLEPHLPGIMSLYRTYMRGD